MTRKVQLWEVVLEVDGRRVVRHERVEFGQDLAAASAEAHAIRTALANGATHARCISSRFLYEVEA